MAVEVVSIWKVWMDVMQGYMPVRMLVLYSSLNDCRVFMLMMLVVSVLMLMLQGFVSMLMLMALGQMKPETQPH